MAKKSKQSEFFPDSRVEFRMTTYTLLESRGGEKRSKLTIEMPITGQDFKGMPDWISDPYAEMAKDESLTVRSNLNVMLEGMTMDIFTMPKTRSKSLSSTGVMMTSFALVAAGEGEGREISLVAAIYVPANKLLHDFAWDHNKKTFFAAFEYSQTEMEFGDSDEEGDGEGLEAAGDEGDEPGDPDTRTAVAGRARKGFDPKAVQNAVH